MNQGGYRAGGTLIHKMWLTVRSTFFKPFPNMVKVTLDTESVNHLHWDSGVRTLPGEAGRLCCAIWFK